MDQHHVHITATPLECHRFEYRGRSQIDSTVICINVIAIRYASMLQTFHIKLFAILKIMKKSIEVGHTARVPNLRHDLITATVSSVSPKQSNWSIMIS
mgnify:CR=1 FL=1